MSTKNKIESSAPFTPDQEACIDTIASVLGGRHNLPKFQHWGTGVAVNYGGDLSTYDGSRLTGLVIAAHRDGVRIEIGSSGPQRVRIIAHKRAHGERREMHSWAYHPNLDNLVKTVTEAKK